MVVLDNLAGAFTPESYGKLIDQVVAEKSVAAQVSTVLGTSGYNLVVPLWTADPATGFVAEGAEIAKTDPTTGELVIVPVKVAGLTEISNEAAADTNPAVGQQTGLALARQIINTIDSAMFAATQPTNGFSGVLATGGYTEVDNAGSYANLDPFLDARYASEAVGGHVTKWVVAPDVAQTLAKLKTASGSNQNLLQYVDDGLQLAGVQVIVSKHVAVGEAWGFSGEQTLFVQRTGTTVVTSADAAFSRDSVQVRATGRVAPGFALPAANVRIYDVTPA